MGFRNTSPQGGSEAEIADWLRGLGEALLLPLYDVLAQIGKTDSSDDQLALPKKYLRLNAKHWKAVRSKCLVTTVDVTHAGNQLANHREQTADMPGAVRN